MASPPHPVVEIVREDSQATMIVAAAASSTIELNEISLDGKDMEACRSKSITVVQEPSIIPQRQSIPIVILKHIWSSIYTFLVSFTLPRREQELDEQKREKDKKKQEEAEYWAELPKRIQHHRVGEYAKGIPQLAALMSSDDNFCVYRIFGRLHTRLLVHLQIQLHGLEKELDELDKKDDENDKLRFRLRIAEHDKAWDAAQNNLLEKIMPKIIEYHDLLLKFHALKEIPEASKSNYQSVLNWIWRFQPIHDEHNGFIFERQDFVRLGLSPQNEAFHDRLLCLIGSRAKSPLNKIFRDPKQYQDTSLHYYSSTRLSFLIMAFVIFLIISILIVPILILYLKPMPNGEKVVVVLLALFVFAISLSLFRDSKPQDLFFGTATYCTVLLVFLATNQTGPISS